MPPTFLAVLIALAAISAACSSNGGDAPAGGTAAVTPDKSPATATPAVAFFAKDAIARARTYAQTVPFQGLSGPTCFEVLTPNNFFSAQAIDEGDGVWTVYVAFATFEVYADTGAAKSLTTGFC